MKKFINKFWGIAIIVTLLASMLISAAPVAAGTLTFSTAGAPNPGPGGVPSNQILASDVNLIRVAPNGDIFVVNKQGAVNIIYKSVNGGQSWTTTLPVIGSPLVAGDNVVDLQISPSYTTDSTVFLLANVAAAQTRVFVSSNAGASFNQLGGNIGGGAAEVGTSLALEPTYMSGVGQIVVSTATIGGQGDIYTWGTNGVLNWTNTAFGTGLPANNFHNAGAIAPNNVVTSVARVAFSPLYPIDATLVAVITQPGAAGTTVSYKVAGNAWNSATLPDQALPGVTATNAALVTADVAFPSDFNASIALSRNFYLGIGASVAGTDNVFRVRSTGIVSLAVVAADTPVNSVAYMGTFNSGTLYVGLVGSTNVWYTANANTPLPGNILWIPTGKAPTGGTLVNAGTATTAVALSGTSVYAGTFAPTLGGVGDETAFSVSYDGGANFYQIGLIDTALTTIQDLALADANLWFMATSDGGVGLESLWKSTNGGATWLRIHTLATGTNLCGVTLSTNFATDNTMYFYEIGGIAGSLISLSQDGGNTWTPRAYPGIITTVGRVLAVDQFVVYVADAGAARVFKSVNNGFFWAAQTVGTAAVNQIKLHAGTGAMLAGTTNGMAYLSTDGATWKKQGATVGAGAMVVAFDANYGTNNIIYAGQTAAAGIFRQTAGASGATPWFNIDGTSLVSTLIGDIFVAPDGVLYATDPTANAGMIRALVPTSGAGPVATAPAPALVGGAAFTLTAGSTLSAIDYLPGSNIIYSIDTTGVAVRTFTDTLSTPIPAVVAPANSAIINAAAINVQIETVTGATAYQVQWSMRDDYNPGVNGGTEAFLPAPFNSRILGTTVGPQPLPGSIVYYRVRVSAPVVGQWSQTFMVNTQLTPAGAPNAPVIVAPATPEGSTAQGGFNVDPTASFFWGVVTGATTYEFQLATDAGLTNLVVDATGANALGNVTSYTVTSPLSYSTAYYWRVRAKSAASETSWSNVQAFRVMDQPTVAPTSTGTTGPTITITTQPAPTITFTQPQATNTTITIPSAPATTEVGPAYIWAIIIIGAVLVIAVIVLIVRTRRSV